MGNILVKARGGESPLKFLLTDFGLAVHLDHLPLCGLTFVCHPEIYRAPEVFYGKGANLHRNRSSAALQYTRPEKFDYGVAVDIWAYGCLMCDVGGGQSPCADLRKQKEEHGPVWEARLVRRLLDFTGVSLGVADYQQSFKSASAFSVGRPGWDASAMGGRLSGVVCACVRANPADRVLPSPPEPSNP
jgi:serine/threonine protein kinase